MSGNVIFISGGRGVGKTTLCGQVVRRMRVGGWQVAGFLSPARFDASGRKVGIDLLDVASGERHPLAQVRSRGPTDVGRYVFNRETIRLGENLARTAPPNGLLVVDELGPMELERGQGWVGALEALQAGHFRAALVVVRPELLETARRQIAPGAPPALHVTPQNRDSLVEEVVRLLNAL
jgi:nucleoside-triphosphatase THEP1